MGPKEIYGQEKVWMTDPPPGYSHSAPKSTGWTENDFKVPNRGDQCEHSSGSGSPFARTKGIITVAICSLTFHKESGTSRYAQPTTRSRGDAYPQVQGGVLQQRFLLFRVPWTEEFEAEAKKHAKEEGVQF